MHDITDQQILATVDHTLLKPTATWEEIKVLCNEAMENKTASVCVPPAYINQIAAKFKDLTICTVIGFPLGYSHTLVKIEEAKQAIADGATEIDMVINIGHAKEGLFEKITDEIAGIKRVCGKNILKVIIETCYLTDKEKIELCKCVTNGKADYIKTSTGFGTAGATLEDVFLFKKHVGENVKIKAAGGIRTRDDMVSFISAGASRLGTSSAINILNNKETSGY